MPKNEYEPRSIIVFSGGASTANAVLEAQYHGKLDRIKFVGFMATNDTAGSRIDFPKYTFLENPNIQVIDPRNYRTEGKRDRKKYGNVIAQYMESVGANSIVMLGNDEMMPNEPVEKSLWTINQHPAPLDPGRVDEKTGEHMDFGDLRGNAAVAAQLAYFWATGERNYWTEATVHYVDPDERFDSGKLLRIQRLDIPLARPSIEGWYQPIPIPVIEKDLLSVIKEKTKYVRDLLITVEYENVIAALEKLEHEVPAGFTRDIPLIPGAKHDLAIEAKRFARRVAPRGEFIAA